MQIGPKGAEVGGDWESISFQTLFTVFSFSLQIVILVIRCILITDNMGDQIARPSQFYLYY